ncbi:hypothetical protein NP233_g1576 [Leucocoprinus birnbaumii]|uniref:Uncharacterized protein n=1 Tax=Leucocoprinus birnbaumii TaxID=56174 RepID=A0AAD5W0A5_9AGAR|nr:hypothetical protein NP233_g1576 [Leucocoprinus birnbaumii]
MCERAQAIYLARDAPDAEIISKELSIDSPYKEAIASTVSTFAKLQRQLGADSERRLSVFLPGHLVLVPAGGPTAIGEGLLDFLRNLCSLANSTAEGFSCSSILAGPGNESDEMGDVAIWLGQGEFGPGNERNVLGALGLTPWLEQGAAVSSRSRNWIRSR